MSDKHLKQFEEEVKSVEDKIKEQQVEPNKTPLVLTQRITVGIPTRNRYDHLALLLWSLLEQSYKNFDIVIIDDSDPQFNVTQIPFIFPMLMKLEHEGHSWCCVPGEKRGPHISHQKIVSMAKTDLIFRVDDDCILDKYCLEHLMQCLCSDPLIGAVAPIIALPHVKVKDQYQPEGWHSIEQYFGKLIERPNGAVDIYGDLQWKFHRNMLYKKSEHLYSSFLYKKSAALGIGGFAQDLSEVGHREETDFTFRLHLAGWKLYVVPESVIWHFNCPSGGIRDDKKKEKDPKKLWEADNYRFLIKYHEFWKKGKLRESVNIGEIK